jgi:predicted nucleotide-binding protein
MLQPVILSNLAPDGKTILEALLAQAETDLSYVIVLLTPDDEGHPVGKPNQFRTRARQNVVLEMGMFLGKLGREKVAILHKGDIELPSDINGLIYIPFTTSINEVVRKLFVALHKAGLPVDVEGLSAE